MKDNYRKLQALLKILNMDDFYVISIWDNSIKLQGKYNPKTVISAMEKKFTSHLNDSTGHVQLRRSNVEITLT